MCGRVQARAWLLEHRAREGSGPFKVLARQRSQDSREERSGRPRLGSEDGQTT